LKQEGGKKRGKKGGGEKKHLLSLLLYNSSRERGGEEKRGEEDLRRLSNIHCSPAADTISSAGILSELREEKKKEKDPRRSQSDELDGLTVPSIARVFYFIKRKKGGKRTVDGTALAVVFQPDRWAFTVKLCVPTTLNGARQRKKKRKEEGKKNQQKGGHHGPEPNTGGKAGEIEAFNQPDFLVHEEGRKGEGGKVVEGTEGTTFVTPEARLCCIFQPVPTITRPLTEEGRGKGKGEADEVKKGPAVLVTTASDVPEISLTTQLI